MTIRVPIGAAVGSLLRAIFWCGLDGGLHSTSGGSLYDLGGLLPALDDLLKLLGNCLGGLLHGVLGGLRCGRGHVDCVLFSRCLKLACKSALLEA